MTVKSLDLSEKIDSRTIDVLDAVTHAAQELDIRCFLVGAIARDLVLYYGYGIARRQLTYDMDIAIEVSDWNEFANLRDSLLTSSQFSSAPEPQRLLYEDNFPVDIVPFGEVGGTDGELAWPPDQHTKMSVLGFEEAYENSLTCVIRSDPKLEVRMASPAGLVVLKLIAWSDRPSERAKDAVDLALLLRSYLDTGNRDRLFSGHLDLMDEDFDYELTGARLLGRDVAALASEPTIRVLTEILKDETREGDRLRLVEQMGTNGYYPDFEENLEFLRALKRGLLEPK